MFIYIWWLIHHSVMWSLVDFICYGHESNQLSISQQFSVDNEHNVGSLMHSFFINQLLQSYIRTQPTIPTHFPNQYAHHPFSLENSNIPKESRNKGKNRQKFNNYQNSHSNKIKEKQRSCRIDKGLVTHLGWFWCWK